MQQFISLVIESGRTGLDMALYILLPIMVVMLALMKLLEAKGALRFIVNKLSPITHIFGIPGLGVFAMIKLLFVSFAAPIPSLLLMENGNTSRRHIAATLAMVMAMSQANASFPLSAVGLDLGFALCSSLFGGLCAAAFTYYVLCRHLANNDARQNVPPSPTPSDHPSSVIQILVAGGQEGVKIAIGMIPMLILALLLVNSLKAVGAIDFLSTFLAPALGFIGLPETAMLPIITKFIAGGTAFTGVTIDLIKQGLLSPLELNRMAGFVLNPLDIAGVAVFATVGKRLGSILRYAVYGALFGLCLRGILHLMVF
ncbi:MAG: nucleoside recognition family protein [Cycloclasticus sp.]